MRKERVEAVRAVTAAFLPTEQASHFVAVETTRCLMTMLEMSTKVPVGTGADAIVLVGEAASHAASAHALLAKAHIHLRPIPVELGVPQAAGTDECYPNEGVKILRTLFGSDQREETTA